MGGLPTYYSRHRLSENVTRLDGSCCDLSLFKNKRVFAFAGLADNQQFFQSLGALGVLPAVTMSLPDHVDYTKELQQSIAARARGCNILLTTEKDAVKLAGNMFELPCYYVSLDLDIANGQELLRLISNLLWR
jgi:tetraacyldisaccharide 4'-kinase